MEGFETVCFSRNVTPAELRQGETGLVFLAEASDDQSGNPMSYSLRDCGNAVWWVWPRVCVNVAQILAAGNLHRKWCNATSGHPGSGRPLAAHQLSCGARRMILTPPASVTWSDHFNNGGRCSSINNKHDLLRLLVFLCRPHLWFLARRHPLRVSFFLLFISIMDAIQLIPSAFQSGSLKLRNF